MKRSVILLLLGSVCWSFSAMAGEPEGQAKKIAVIWATKSGMVSNLVMGFLPRMRQIAPDLQVTLHRQLKDMEEAQRVFHECEKTMDGIVFLRSPGAEYLSRIRPKVPCFVGACNNPTELGVIKNLAAPEGMVTGVTYFIPYEKRFVIMKSLFPNLKTVALLVERGHPSGPIEQAGTREQCSRLGIEYKEVVAGNLEELLTGTRALGKVDLIIISNTRLAMDSVANLLPIANATRIPLFSFAELPVKAGAVAGTAADDTILGEMLADTVVDVVAKGKAISQVPVKMDPDPKVFINESMMTSLGLKFPDAILNRAVVFR